MFRKQVRRSGDLDEDDLPKQKKVVEVGGDSDEARTARKAAKTAKRKMDEDDLLKQKKIAEVGGDSDPARAARKAAKKAKRKIGQEGSKEARAARKGLSQTAQEARATLGKKPSKSEVSTKPMAVELDAARKAEMQTEKTAATAAAAAAKAGIEEAARANKKQKTAAAEDYATKFKDTTYECRNCTENFVDTAADQKFRSYKGFAVTPVRCKDCRSAKRERMEAKEAAAKSKGEGKSEDDENTVFVKGLSATATEKTLNKHFRKCGTIMTLRMPLSEREQDKGSCKGFCFIKFDSKEGMDKALAFNKTEFDGKTLCCSDAANKKPEEKVKRKDSNGKDGKSKGKGKDAKGKDGKSKGKDGKGKGKDGKSKGKDGKGKDKGKKGKESEVTQKETGALVKSTGKRVALVDSDDSSGE